MVASYSQNGSYPEPLISHFGHGITTNAPPPLPQANALQQGTSFKWQNQRCNRGMGIFKDFLSVFM